MPAILRFYEDVLSSTASDVHLPPLPRMIFVVHGTLTIAAHTFGAEQAWQGDGPVVLSAGHEGATCWRWELASDDRDGRLNGAGMASREKLSARLHTLPQGDLLMRGDSVAFPPGGCAYLHTHQGPGIRCLLEGGIRIDTHGTSTSYGPGSPWFEAGPEPVFAQAAMDRPSRFIRVMILPRALLGKSSLQLVNEDDKAKPRAQQYKIYADAPIELPTTTRVRRTEAGAIIVPIADLWTSTDLKEWEDALERYWSFVQPKNIAPERSLDTLDLDRLRSLNARGWYNFLKDEYFRWKYTAPNRYASTTRELQRYIEDDALSVCPGTY